MFRVVVSFVVLFVAGAAVLAFLPSASRSAVGAPVPSVAAQAVGMPGRSDRGVRVVYAPSDGSAQVSGSIGADAQEQSLVVPGPKTIDTSVAAVTSAAAVQPASLETLGKTDLNTASIDQLDSLSGGGRIGRTIVSHRPYRSVEELLAKRVVRKSVYDRIKDQVTSATDRVASQ